MKMRTIRMIMALLILFVLCSCTSNTTRQELEKEIEQLQAKLTAAESDLREVDDFEIKQIHTVPGDNADWFHNQMILEEELAIYYQKNDKTYVLMKSAGNKSNILINRISHKKGFATFEYSVQESKECPHYFVLYQLEGSVKVEFQRTS